jgi:hypothetical protein
VMSAGRAVAPCRAGSVGAGWSLAVLCGLDAPPRRLDRRLRENTQRHDAEGAWLVLADGQSTQVVYLLAGIGQLQSGLYIGGESNPLFGYRYYYPLLLSYSLLLLSVSLPSLLGILFTKPLRGPYCTFLPQLLKTKLSRNRNGFSGIWGIKV